MEGSLRGHFILAIPSSWSPTSGAPTSPMDLSRPPPEPVFRWNGRYLVSRQGASRADKPSRMTTHHRQRTLSRTKCRWCSTPTLFTHSRLSSPTAMNTSPQGTHLPTYQLTWTPKQESHGLCTLQTYLHINRYHPEP
jgi:hypothetical protein